MNVCQICSQLNADLWCADCQESYCDRCYKNHNCRNLTIEKEDVLFKCKGNLELQYGLQVMKDKYE